MLFIDTSILSCTIQNPITIISKTISTGTGKGTRTLKFMFLRHAPMPKFGYSGLPQGFLSALETYMSLSITLQPL